ncbi:MAG: signal peptide peptidase SppA [Bacteroidetes bacterium]|nr:signal peptide peptidase SppA [Bacteroidota bacterium]
MGSFFRSFFATILALLVFSGICIIILFVIASGIINGITSSRKAEVGAKAILVLDLNQAFHEQKQDNFLASIGSDDEYDVPGLYDVVRLIHHAKTDSAVKGIYIKSNHNSNGFASSEEIRNALLDFKSSGKFIYAYGDVIEQKSYYVANVADKIYCNPKGGVDWKGFAAEITFLKGTLQKLEIEPQIFYAGKFKSATEPLREEKMTDANRLQTAEFLNALYNRLLYSTSEERNIDTTTLRKMVNEHLVQFAADAEKYKLVDGLKYDDEVKSELKEKLGIGKYDKINFIHIEKYADAVNYKQSGSDRIALIYAEGDIVDGKGKQDQIGGDTYRSLIRKARLDKDIKAIVIRVNSGGGSSLASENMWREITIAREEKPVIISFGDVAASGGYYMSCNADSIFAEPSTLTGSIGVFTILMNMQKFFKDKIGVTFDGVKTAPDADALSVSKPLTEMQKRYFQTEIDSIYHDFKSRVADGRKKDINYVDSIAQGRVWVGDKALSLGLVDRIGGLQDAVNCAARMAKISDYSVKEFPEPRGLFDQLFGNYKNTIHVKAMKEELGEDGYKTYSTITKLRSLIGTTQARIPYDITIE